MLKIGLRETWMIIFNFLYLSNLHKWKKKKENSTELCSLFMAKFWYLLFLTIHKRKEYRTVETKSLWLLRKYTLCKTVNFNCIGGKLWVRKASLNLLMSESLIMSNMAFPHWFWMMTVYGKKKFLKIPNYCCHYFQMKDMRIHPKWTMLKKIKATYALILVHLVVLWVYLLY